MDTGRVKKAADTGELEEEYKQQLKHEVETSDDGPLVNWDMDLVTFEGNRYVIEYIL